MWPIFVNDTSIRTRKGWVPVADLNRKETCHRKPQTNKHIANLLIIGITLKIKLTDKRLIFSVYLYVSGTHFKATLHL